MTKLLRFLPEAEAELRAAAEWYDDRAGLGDELVAEVQTVTSRVVEMPGAFASARGVRAAVGAYEARVKRFPYRVIFGRAGGGAPRRRARSRSPATRILARSPQRCAVMANCADLCGACVPAVRGVKRQLALADQEIADASLLRDAVLSEVPCVGGS